MMKLNIRNISIRSLLALLVVFVAACQKDDVDHPPFNELDSGKIITIQQLRAMYSGQPVRFEENFSVFGIITTDERTGNFYRSHYIQDETGAINIRLDSGVTLAVGDSVRLSLKGTTLSAYNNMLQVDSVLFGKNLITQERGLTVEPKVVTISEITAGGMQGQLIILENVQFSQAHLGLTYADPLNQVTMNRDLEDCNGNRIIVRTSGFATFAGTQVAQGNGSLVAIVSVFGSTWQLLIRDPEELDMTGERCQTGGNPQGSGTFEDPYNVAFGIAFNSGVGKWVEGYIVGVMETDVDPFEANFIGPWRTNSNIIIADDPNETNLNKCMMVQLPIGDIRDALNLVSNPDNKGKIVKVQGNLEAYFGQPGIRTLTGFWIEGGTVPQEKIFEENFNSDLGTFTAYSILGDQQWGHATFDGGCAVMSGYANNTNHANEDWLVSPAIDLSEKNNVQLQIREAINFITSHNDMKLLVSSDYQGGDPTQSGTWTELTGFNRPPGSGWTFFDSGNIDLSAYDGQTIRIAFKYLSTTSGAATWEVSKVLLIEGN
ncbi:MAG: choice-of-anchor J domain-containing protein [Bacteroidales bacterium]|nr:choice-of-anchor J domain-containing protein [Bacteroidales bacterium]